jgi:hypothetical protein
MFNEVESGKALIHWDLDADTLPIPLPRQKSGEHRLREQKPGYFIHNQKRSIGRLLEASSEQIGETCRGLDRIVNGWFVRVAILLGIS